MCGRAAGDDSVRQPIVPCPGLRDEGKKFGVEYFVDAGHGVDNVFIDVHYAKDFCACPVESWRSTIPITVQSEWWRTGSFQRNLGHVWKPYQILKNTISWIRSDLKGDDSRDAHLHIELMQVHRS